jgi:transcriptional regulator with XRE-family HTH domain
MKPLVPPAALRVARALLGKSQVEISKAAGVALASLRAVETGTRSVPEANARLRNFYEDRGIEFLGLIDIGSGVATGVGARWRDPETSSPQPQKEKLPSIEHEVSFGAARAYLALNMKDVTGATGLTERTLRAVESNQPVDSADRRRLVVYYRSLGVRLLGRRDADSGLYLGVGVVGAPPSSEV